MSLVRPFARLAPLALALAWISAAACAAANTPPAAPPAQEPGTPAAAPAGAAAGMAPASGFRRIELPGGKDQPFPYTVEIPADWQMQDIPKTASLLLGPPTADPAQSPRGVIVRISTVSLADPAAVVANIKASDAADAKWAASLVEEREVHGVRGILVRMDSGEGEAARSTLTLKLPLQKTSVDFIGSAPRGEFEAVRPLYERVLFSVEPRK